VSHLVLAEATRVLSAVYDLAPRDIATAVEMFLSHERLTLQEADVVAAAVAQFRRRPSLRFSDCLVPEVAREAGNVPLGTFDRELGKLDGAQKL
jgi:predicted nucleic-acid-binding protein